MRVLEESVVTCPMCGTMATERMPADACQIVYQCRGCGATLRPKAGDCCVFCSYGSVPAGAARTQYVAGLTLIPTIECGEGRVVRSRRTSSCSRGLSVAGVPGEA
ncbi:MAG TPA: GDCCVxC domain-containing (seleno)protein [bacterium]|nr:GDCCVxC domain-containing (seleno)protein [bacterium]